MHKVLFEQYPEAQLNILIVWIKMYESDSIEKVQRASKLFRDDPRVTQFYDPGKIAGLELAEGLGAGSGEIAWDIYLFFDARAEWLDQLPVPRDWVHQMKGSSWADPGRLHLGDQLTRKLREIMLNLFQNEVGELQL